MIINKSSFYFITRETDKEEATHKKGETIHLFREQIYHVRKT